MGVVQLDKETFKLEIFLSQNTSFANEKVKETLNMFVKVIEQIGLLSLNGRIEAEREKENILEDLGKAFKEVEKLRENMMVTVEELKYVLGYVEDRSRMEILLSYLEKENAKIDLLVLNNTIEVSRENKPLENINIISEEIKETSNRIRETIKEMKALLTIEGLN